MVIGEGRIKIICQFRRMVPGEAGYAPYVDVDVNHQAWTSERPIK